MIKLLRGQRETKTRKEQDRLYEELLGNPYNRLLTSVLNAALVEKATAVCFGFRGNNSASVPTFPTNEMMAEICGAGESERVRAAKKESVRLHGPGKESHIPMWFEIEDKLVEVVAIPAVAYPHVLVALSERLVSVGSTGEQPMPTKYIELDREEGMRRLVEVDMYWDVNDTFWVRLVGERRETEGTRISRWVC